MIGRKTTTKNTSNISHYTIVVLKRLPKVMLLPRHLNGLTHLEGDLHFFLPSLHQFPIFI